MALSFYENLKKGLEKTRSGFVKNLDEMIFGEKIISQDIFEDLEEILITADLGPRFTDDLIEELKNQAKRQELLDAATLKEILKNKMKDILAVSDRPLQPPDEGVFTVMVVGVNGTGKTTTIGKMAAHFVSQDRSVLLVAADTFRAAAIEQLEIWAQRSGASLVKQTMGSDPAAVVYDGLQAAVARHMNTVIIDTAGRLHTKVNLMNELKKIKRIMAREMDGAPHETLLVLDATTGQNAVSQADLFQKEIGITGLALTKLDGTAKGGIVIRIAAELQIPIRYIGIGEKIEDLRPFSGSDFVDALFA